MKHYQDRIFIDQYPLSRKKILKKTLIPLLLLSPAIIFVSFVTTVVLTKLTHPEFFMLNAQRDKEISESSQRLDQRLIDTINELKHPELTPEEHKAIKLEIRKIQLKNLKINNTSNQKVSRRRSLGTAQALFIIGLLFITLFMFLFVGILVYWYQRWYYRTYFYNMTDKLIIIRKGPLAPREITIPFERIQDIYVDQDIFDRLFNIYDVHISTATAMSGGRAHIDGVTKETAEKLRNLILKNVEEARRKK